MTIWQISGCIGSIFLSGIEVVVLRTIVLLRTRVRTGIQSNTPMAYTITNVNGSTSRAVLPSGYSSWIDYWEKKTGLTTGYCKCDTCLKQATDGAHVNVEGHGNYWYIVPLCHEHNMTTGSLHVSGPLVPVNPDLSILW